MAPDRESVERARSFGSAALDYDRYRPGYPDEAATLFGPIAERTVVDVGAGTGLFTAFLARLGAHVIAVEIDPLMADVLRAAVPSATVYVAPAEALPLEDASADVVACSSAWHWFTQPQAASEFARVVRPGGDVFALWNGFDEDVSWLEEVRQLREPNRQSSFARRHRAADFPDEWFTDVTPVKLTWTWSRTIEEVVQVFGTYSGLLTQPEEDRARVLDDVRARLVPHAVAGRLDLPMAVRGTRAVRR